MRLDLAIDKALPGFVLQVRLATDAGVLVLFGPSGAGKSLTLQCLAGIIRPDRGHISADGEPLFDSSAGVDVPPQGRRIGYVPQSYALFPHLTAAENITFGLRRRPRSEARAEVARLLALLRLTGLEHRRPAELSGGQQQRVALARALATRPRLLLLDEPFSALDASVREALRADLLEIQHEFGVGVVFVTHDLADTAFLADAVAVYEHGQVLQVGSRAEVFRHPATAGVARLTGARNLLPASVVGTAQEGICVSLGGVQLWAGSSSGPVGQEVLVVMRPEDLRLLADGEPASEDEEVMSAVVRGAAAQGHYYTVQVRLGSGDGPLLEVATPVWWWERFGGVSDAQLRVAIARRAVHALPANPVADAAPPEQPNRPLASPS